MNTQLVESLVKLIQSLPQEERQLFEEKLFFESNLVTTQELMKLAVYGHSFDFLNDEPELYTFEDGEAI
ncbi:hypothetical protein C7H19_15005 [Aphanothece hegewaldii CCALA 016]|uniref:DUF2281 domain-containing protein n=1 Tax=Aphanothece hegewaldii CCALA 016 TaxID=2107694 RepID=A0A2T1LW12_9CHRO|nr:hypothetical protein [Aphanothece hegewaldii]PSF36048.1 hypothetical protein C7H19_15005 [Aphanothece hegewaldii CCALA 016]